MDKSPSREAQRLGSNSSLLARPLSPSDLTQSSPLSHPNYISNSTTTNSLSSTRLSDSQVTRDDRCGDKYSFENDLELKHRDVNGFDFDQVSDANGSFDKETDGLEAIEDLESFEVPTVFLKEGLPLLKVSHKSRKRILLKVDPENFKFIWKYKNKSYEFLVDDVRNYTVRDKASNYREEFGISKEFEKLWLSVTYYNHSKNKLKALHVIADTNHDYKRLLSVIRSFKRLKDEILRNFLLNLKDLDDVKRSIIAGKAEPTEKHVKELLTFPDILKFSKRLNINLNPDYLEKIFRNVHSTSAGDKAGLNFEEFKKFVSILKRRDDIDCLWNDLVGYYKVMSFESFKRFIIQVQKEDFDLEYLQKLFKKFANDGVEHWVQENLNSYMLSKFCSPLKEDFMNEHYFSHPLNEYYTLSSHNTYLIGRQVAGDSSIEGYIKALQRGCRCLEVDIWNNEDDPEGEPIVNHGRTFTTGISLSNVLKTIKKYAFQSSPYPVILSLEIHCTGEGQLKVVSILKDILGEVMVDQPINFESNLPSPESLRNRILIKVKKTTTSENMGLDETGKFVSTSTTGTSFSESNESGTPRKLKLRRRTTSRKILEVLSDLGIYVQGIKFRNFSLPESKTYNHCFSLGEKLINSMLKEEVKLAALDKHNRKYLMRVYPSKIRIKSSNFLPLDYWAHGVQMVATNWQTYDLGQQLNESMFEVVQGRGYVLKPHVLRKPLLKSSMRKIYSTNVVRTKFSIRVISAHQLPKPAECMAAINPFIILDIIGANSVNWDSDSRVGATNIIAENGFNPIWNLKYSGTIESETELVFIRLSLHSSTSPREFVNTKEVGILVVKLSDMKQGYRYFPLNDLSGEQLLYSSIFLKVEYNSE